MQMADGRSSGQAEEYRRLRENVRNDLSKVARLFRLQQMGIIETAAADFEICAFEKG
jgi:chromosome condensin MukBEF MukE localization factor